MTENTDECLKCLSEIPSEASACRDCGYEPAKIGSTARTVYIVVGAILCLTIVGAVVGLPLLLLGGYAHHKASGRKPTEYDPA